MILWLFKEILKIRDGAPLSGCPLSGILLCSVKAKMNLKNKIKLEVRNSFRLFVRNTFAKSVPVLLCMKFVQHDFT